MRDLQAAGGTALTSPHPVRGVLSGRAAWALGLGIAVLGYGVLLYSISFRWLNLFPEEKELATKG